MKIYNVTQISNPETLKFYTEKIYKFVNKKLRMSESKLQDVAGMRIKYKDRDTTFTEDHLVSKNPIIQFKDWFEFACKTPTIKEATAMILSTATKNGIPSGRPVLLKGFSDEGFKFYTNYESRKGSELAENPNAALTFYWGSLFRTIRIEGIVQKTSPEDSDEYFKSRPFASQVGACISKQSSVIPNRDILMIKERELIAKYDNETLKRPNFWGGYILKPHSIEFWQGQSDRLHDRIHFRRLKPNEKIDNILLHQGENDWVYERLSP